MWDFRFTMKFQDVLMGYGRNGLSQKDKLYYLFFIGVLNT